MAKAEKITDSPFPTGPQPGISYPLRIQYCGGKRRMNQTLLRLFIL